jgi:hypothetical protein
MDWVPFLLAHIDKDATQIVLHYLPGKLIDILTSMANASIHPVTRPEEAILVKANSIIVRYIHPQEIDGPKDVLEQFVGHPNDLLETQRSYPSRFTCTIDLDVHIAIPWLSPFYLWPDVLTLEEWVLWDTVIVKVLTNPNTKKSGTCRIMGQNTYLFLYEIPDELILQPCIHEAENLLRKMPVTDMTQIEAIHAKALVACFLSFLKPYRCCTEHDVYQCTRDEWLKNKVDFPSELRLDIVRCEPILLPRF